MVCVHVYLYQNIHSNGLNKILLIKGYCWLRLDLCVPSLNTIVVNGFACQIISLSQMILKILNFKVLEDGQQVEAVSGYLFIMGFI